VFSNETIKEKYQQTLKEWQQNGTSVYKFHLEGKSSDSNENYKGFFDCKSCRELRTTIDGVIESRSYGSFELLELGKSISTVTIHMTCKLPPRSVTFAKSVKTSKSNVIIPNNCIQMKTISSNITEYKIQHCEPYDQFELYACSRSFSQYLKLTPVCASPPVSELDVDAIIKQIGDYIDSAPFLPLRIFLAGPKGSGKTSFLNTILSVKKRKSPNPSDGTKDVQMEYLPITLSDSYQAGNHLPQQIHTVIWFYPCTNIGPNFTQELRLLETNFKASRFLKPTAVVTTCDREYSSSDICSILKSTQVEDKIDYLANHTAIDKSHICKTVNYTTSSPRNYSLELTALENLFLTVRLAVSNIIESYAKAPTPDVQMQQWLQHFSRIVHSYKTNVEK